MLMSGSDDPPKGIGRRSHMGIGREHCQTSNKEALMKNRKIYVMTKSNLTLTQSGLLAVLLQPQRHKVIELVRHPAHRRQVRASFWSSLTRRWGALTARTLVDDSAKPSVGTVPRHT
jgi:hypothetical protein